MPEEYAMQTIKAEKQRNIKWRNERAIVMLLKQNSEMTIYTPDKRLDYVIVAAYNYDDSHIMNSFDFSRDEIYSDFLETVKNPHSITSNVRQGVSLDINDKIVILSTCLDFGEGRFLVVGKLTGETPLAGG